MADVRRICVSTAGPNAGSVVGQAGPNEGPRPARARSAGRGPTRGRTRGAGLEAKAGGFVPATGAGRASRGLRRPAAARPAWRPGPAIGHGGAPSGPRVRSGPCGGAEVRRPPQGPEARQCEWRPRMGRPGRSSAAAASRPRSAACRSRRAPSGAAAGARIRTCCRARDTWCRTCRFRSWDTSGSCRPSSREPADGSVRSENRRSRVPSLRNVQPSLPPVSGHDALCVALSRNRRTTLRFRLRGGPGDPLKAGRAGAGGASGRAPPRAVTARGRRATCCR